MEMYKQNLPVDIIRLTEGAPGLTYFLNLVGILGIRLNNKSAHLLFHPFVEENPRFHYINLLCKTAIAPVSKCQVSPHGTSYFDKLNSLAKMDLFSTPPMFINV